MKFSRLILANLFRKKVRLIPDHRFVRGGIVSVRAAGCGERRLQPRC